MLLTDDGLPYDADDLFGDWIIVYCEDRDMPFKEFVLPTISELLIW